MSDPSHPSRVHGHGQSSSPIDITTTLQNHDLQLQEIKILLHQLVLARDQKSYRSRSHHKGSSLHKASVHQPSPPSSPDAYSNHHNQDFYQQPPKLTAHYHHSTFREPKISLPSFYGTARINYYFNWR